MRALFGSFDSSQITVLQATFDHVCEELGINERDEEARSRVAASVIALAKIGQLDPDRLRLQAVSQLKAVDDGRAA